MWLLIVAGIGILIAATTTGVLVYWKRSANAQRYLPSLHAAEDAYAIPRDLLARLAYQESRFRDDIITGALRSSAGASGIMQLIPRFYPGVDPLDPYQSINAAAKSLAGYFKQFGTWKLALAAYNWGPGNLSKNLDKPGIWPKETLDYVSQITQDVPVV